MKTIIIAEAGVNHNGSLELAKQLINVAKDAGADYVKFQTFKTELLVSDSAPKADYQQKALNDDGGQFAMLKKLELSEDMHRELVSYCHTNGITFLSTAFDLESIDLLYRLGIRLFKIPSGEITNYPYLVKIARTASEIILSTGMSSLEEVSAALKVLVDEGFPKDKIIILHCNTEYPTPMSDVNLRAMNRIGSELGVRVGYSDHTLGIEVPIAAVALGAVCIEKHFTLSREMEGPDHKASLEPQELKAMVQAVRNIEKALGSEQKQPTASELKNKTAARKSIHLSKNVSAGHILTEEDLIAKRPGNGISPMQWKNVMGKKLTRNVFGDALLSWEDLE